MTKSAVITTRIDPELKRNADQIFKDLGLTASEAITLFYRQVDLFQGLPFPVSVPNAETVKAMRDAQARRGLKKFDNVQTLFDDLDV
jgi:DNA-damage-inducible protein J